MIGELVDGMDLRRMRGTMSASSQRPYNSTSGNDRSVSLLARHRTHGAVALPMRKESQMSRKKTPSVASTTKGKIKAASPKTDACAARPGSDNAIKTEGCQSSWKRDALPLSYTREEKPRRKRRTTIRDCQQCGKPFEARLYEVSRGWGLYCSQKCNSKSRSHLRLKPLPGTKAQKLRANGLINMRIKRGKLTRPTACDDCLKACRPDAHHDDYSKPAEVRWLCRSCHMKTHFRMQAVA